VEVTCRRSLRIGRWGRRRSAVEAAPPGILTQAASAIATGPTCRSRC